MGSAFSSTPQSEKQFYDFSFRAHPPIRRREKMVGEHIIWRKHPLDEAALSNRSSPPGGNLGRCTCTTRGKMCNLNHCTTCTFNLLSAALTALWKDCQFKSNYQECMQKCQRRKSKSIDHFRIVSIRPGWAHSQRRVGVNITIPLHWPSCEWTLTLPIFLVFVRYQQ